MATTQVKTVTRFCRYSVLCRHECQANLYRVYSRITFEERSMLRIRP